MAITATERENLIGLLVGMFDASPNAELMEQFVGSLDGGYALSALANDLAGTAEFKSIYPAWLTNEEFAERFATNILDGNADAATLQEGIDFVTAKLNAGSSRGDVALEAVNALMGVPTTDAKFGQAAAAFANKIEVATYFAVTQLDAETSMELLQSVVSGVTADASSVTAQKILIDAGLASSAQSLTTGQDALVGSAGNDSFTSWIFDNSNTAQSGDSIDGGAGTDTLVAEIGNSQAFAISLKTNSLEKAFFRAQTAEIVDNGDNDPTNATSESIDKASQIDAGDMIGTVEFWSYDSRSNLHIEDIQTNSHQTTIGWRNSDSGNVNYEVYFDNITAPDGTTAGSQLFLELLDLEGAADGDGPLFNNPYNGVRITVDGVTYDIAGADPITTSYAALVDALNAALAEEGLTTVTATLGATFSKFNSDDGQQYEGTTIVLTNTGPEVLAGVGWTTPDGFLPPDTNVHTNISNTPPATEDELTQTNVVFDYVGSGSKSGDFVAGEMSQNTTAGPESNTPGIQQFNVFVDRTSWLDTLRSTENTLRKVIATNISEMSDGTGNLRIDDLFDVKDFDASAMVGAVNLTADINIASLAKYLNLTDTGTNPDADDQNFTYTMGSNNDTLAITVEDEIVGHEDFILNLLGGAGNDSITASVVDDNNAGALAETGGVNSDWYTNQTPGVNANMLYIVGGTGNDTIKVLGGGDWLLEGNAGNDDIFVDDSAAKQSWVLGVLGQGATAAAYNGNNADDLISDTTDAATLYKTKLTVSFLGFETTVDVVAGSNFAASQLTINNAIKAAIDGNRVLSTLLSYQDGPGNVLILNSLVDDVIAETSKPVFTLVGSGTAGGGDYAAGDIAGFTASDKEAIIAGNGALVSNSTDAAIAAALNAGIDAYYTGAAADIHLSTQEVEVTTLVGAASTFDNDSVVHADAGDNVVVLSSDLTSNNTVVFDTAWTKTSIVSFEADTAANTAFADVLDFTAFIDIQASVSGSALSAARIATTKNTDATVEINSVTFSTAATFTTTDTFEGLTEAALLSALNNGGTNYAGLADATANAQTNAGGVANVVGTEGKAIFAVQNSGNLGEYKVFQLSWAHDSASNANADFSSATLLGVIDLGDEGSTLATAAFTVAGLA